jgi:hypothetical protein
LRKYLPNGIIFSLRRDYACSGEYIQLIDYKSFLLYNIHDHDALNPWKAITDEEDRQQPWILVKM